MLIEKIEGWMLTAFVTFITFVGWFFKTSQSSKTMQGDMKKIEDRVGKLEDKSTERGEVIARMDERQIGMASDLTEIKKLLQGK